MASLSVGDVLRYTPDQHHCREGTAYVRSGSCAAVDTYWHGFETDNESHLLTEIELSTAEVVFNVNDFDMLDRYSHGSRTTWLTYHPRDRGRIPSHNGLQELLFVRKGAAPDLETQIANARGKAERAEADLRIAESALAHANDDLAKLEGGKDE